MDLSIEKSTGIGLTATIDYVGEKIEFSFTSDPLSIGTHTFRPDSGPDQEFLNLKV